MAKKRITKNSKKARKPRQKLNGRLSGLDTAAYAYARLLADPCNAPLVHPIYPGGDSGNLFRSESVISVGYGATSTAGAFHWTPGYLNGTQDNILWMDAATSSTSVTASNLGAYAPGYTFLSNNTRAVRCVAACMKITYGGSEASRSGRVHYGQSSASYITTGQSNTVDQVATSLQHYSRTPPDTIELVWKPNIGDCAFTDPTANDVPAVHSQKAALTFAWANIPPSTGMIIHMTAVYEWQPLSGLGMGHNNLGKARSRNTLDDVIDALISAGYGFVRNAGSAAGTFLGAGVTAALGQVYGLMPSYQTSRARFNLGS